jgi:Rieske Fe-S protein
MDRRTVLLTGGTLAAAGVVAACSGDKTAEEVVGEAPTVAEEAVEPEASATGEPGTLTTGDIPVGGGVVLQEEAIVVTQPVAGTFAAFTAVCPHQGCLVSEVVDNEIVCPCHDSLFSAENGDVIRGPAVQGLAAAAIAIDGDSVIVG